MRACDATEGSLEAPGVASAFNIQVKVSIYLGVIAASPVWLYQLWAFIAPGLYKRERRYAAPFILLATLFFLLGGYFGYRVILPGACAFFVQTGLKFKQMIKIDEYFSFASTIMLAAGVVFETPILIFFLALFGIVDAKFLLKNFRYAIMAIFLLAAVICPDPSPVGMCLFASPMLVLYFVGVGVAYFVHPNRRKKKDVAKGAA